MTTKACNRCLVSKPETDFYSDKSKKDGRSTLCKECVLSRRRQDYSENPEPYRLRNSTWQKSEAGRKWKARWSADRKNAALEAYGGQCACCGEAEPEFLTIDHVGGWGAEHRKMPGSGAGNILNWLKREGYPQDGTIQLLCWNCNCATGIRGSCPHNRSGEDAP